MPHEPSSPEANPQPTRMAEPERALSAMGFPLDAVVENIEKGQQRLDLRGLDGGALALVLSALQARLGRPFVVLASSTRKLRTLAEDLELFATTTLPGASTLFPPLDVSPYVGLSPNRHRVAERLTSQFRLLIGDVPPFILVSAAGILRRSPPNDVVEQYSDVIAHGSDIDTHKLRHLLVDAGYSPVQLVEDPGTFAIRGGVIDIFSPAYELPVRIELFGDEVERIRYFEPATQKGGDDVDGFYLFPVREEVFTEDTLSIAREKLRILADELHHPTKVLRKVLADLEHGLHFLGIESLLPAFYDSLSSIPQILPDDALLVLLDPNNLAHKITEIRTRLQTQYDSWTRDEHLAFPPDAMYLSLDEVTSWIDANPRIVVGDVEARDVVSFDHIPNHDIRNLRVQAGSGEAAVRKLVERLPELREVYGEIAFACRSTGSAERLISLLGARGQRVIRPEHSVIDLEARPGPPAEDLHVYNAPLSSGVRVPAKSLAIIADHEILGARVMRKRSAKRDISHFVQSFQELKPNDVLVHVEHGIGRYEGLVNIEVGGIRGDYLLIRYAGNDKLYLPVHRLGVVQKLSGIDPTKKLDKLGGSAWERTKSRVKESIKKMAVDLLRLYAERQRHEGHVFSDPGEDFEIFEEAFPYEETPDQLRAIDDVLADMQSPKPMDRLICGDVGFGKTEVSMRAAFTAVLDGAQVAVLVPTTILAEQHLASFRTRYAEQPVRIEALSRFRTSREAKAIVKDLGEGKIDIVIGTHRLLSKDIDFANLGLLIVDEEHRFGVAHKEKIKELSVGVDVLSMTATPIPRTLQMSFMGIRDLSLITTPPRDRLAVRTYVARFGRQVIREAIMRELTRGGQVYFLHNRVKDIEKIASKIREIVPEARIAIAHGQMDERKLETVMLSFIRGESNVLLCTTIIESGLDIPNANAIIINHAERLGLAQLYQIRGRVGRASQRAYAYLLIPEDAKLTDEARARLEAIQRFTELGSGFEIANFDLEIRGAGNVLGAEQSGHIQQIGLDLYTELLNEAIAELRDEEYEQALDPEVNIPLETRLPETYIPDVQLRLLFYKRFSSARTQAELYDLFGELQDRFGAPPEPVTALRDIIELKIMTKALRCEGLDVNRTSLTLTLGERCILDPEKVVSLVTRHRRRYHLKPDMRLIRYFSKKESEDMFGAAKAVLRKLAEHLTLDAYDVQI